MVDMVNISIDEYNKLKRKEAIADIKINAESEQIQSPVPIPMPLPAAVIATAPSFIEPDYAKERAIAKQKEIDEIARLKAIENMKKAADLETKRMQDAFEKQRQFDEVGEKVRQYMDMQESKKFEGKKSRFHNPFVSKKIPKYKTMDKFDKWLKEKCENDCCICDKCEKQLREMIDEVWKWTEKIELKSP